MRVGRGTVATAAIAAGTLVAVAGCGSGHVRPGASDSPAAPAGDPSARAVADVAGLLGAFRPPPGARPSGGRPAGAPADLDRPMFVPNTPDLVTRTRWWTVAGSPESVMSWTSAHPPAGTTSAGGTSEIRSGPTVTELTAMYLAPSVSGGLIQRRLLVQAGALAAGRTALRVDAQETWRPAPPSSPAIPPAAVLTIRAASPHTASPDASAAPPVMTISDRTVIGRVASLVEALPTASRGVVNCPNDTGSHLTLTFASIGGETLATVQVSASGCGFVTINARGGDGLTRTGGPDLVKRLGVLLHTHWPGIG